MCVGRSDAGRSCCHAPCPSLSAPEPHTGQRRAPVFPATVVALASVLIAFLTAQAVLAAADVPLSLGEPGVLRALVGSALYLGVTAALGVAVGSLTRSALGGIAGVFVLLFVVPVAGMLVPAIGPYLPSNAGAAIMQTGSAAGVLPPWIGLGVFLLYAAAALAAAASALARRDA